MIENLFETDFLTDEEIEQMEASLIDNLMYKIFTDEKPSIIVPSKVKEVLFIYSSIKRLFEGSYVKVSYKLHQPLSTIGTIHIEGKIIELQNTKTIMELCSKANNFEIYPLTNGNVKMSLAFYGLTKSMNI